MSTPYKLGTVLGIGASLVMAATPDGCGRVKAPDASVEIYSVPKQQPEGARFRVTRCGVFRAGFENNEREILVIEDTMTGANYLGITGVGVTELKKEHSGKVAVTRER